MRIVMATTGSLGDVFPMIGFGRALRERGHEVTLVSSGEYRDYAATAGLDFVEEMSGDLNRRFMRYMGEPRERKPDELRTAWLRELVPRLQKLYSTIEDSHERGATAVLAYGIELYAAMAADERLGVPFVRIYHVPEPLHRVQPPHPMLGRIHHALLVTRETRFGRRPRKIAREVSFIGKS